MDMAGSCYCIPVSSLNYMLNNMCFADPEHVCPGRFWLYRGWSWVGSAASPAPSRATVLTSCSTPNPSTEGRSTGSPLRFCKWKMVARYNINHSSKADFGWNTKYATILLYFSFSSPNDKKSFCSIEGEWNGVMYAKLATGVSFFISFFYTLFKKNFISSVRGGGYVSNWMLVA